MFGRERDHTGGTTGELAGEPAGSDATFELRAAGCALRLRAVRNRVAPFFAAEPPR